MAHNQRIEIRLNGSRPSARGSAQDSTGSVIVDPLFDATEHTHATGGLVTFEPGARTVWHTHPAGQTLVVTPTSQAAAAGARAAAALNADLVEEDVARAVADRGRVAAAAVP